MIGKKCNKNYIIQYLVEQYYILQYLVILHTSGVELCPMGRLELYVLIVPHLILHGLLNLYSTS